MSATIAFIGLGNIGSDMARHLTGAGHSLTAIARRVEFMQPFVDIGVRAATAPVADTRDADFDLRH